MTEPIKIYNDPSGEAYRQLIDYAIQHSSMFVLTDHEYADPSPQFTSVLEKLSPYLIKKASPREVHNGIAYSEQGTMYFYQCSPESAEILKTEANHLLEWQLPHLPEDLCFLNEKEEEWLVTVAHENIKYLHITEEEAERLSQEITGLFLTGEFNQELDLFLRDAKRHQTESLDISDYLIAEIPEIVGEITSLKALSIFEQNITRLPAFLFNLHQLEKLSIWVEKLEELPKEIGQLTNLKHLTIYCVCYTRLEEGQRIIDKREVPFHRLPAEIGLLTNLETLDIQATSLSSLPKEIANLKKLKSVTLCNNLFETTPPELDALELENLVMDRPEMIPIEELLK